jgi:hypothetical protein
LVNAALASFSIGEWICASGYRTARFSTRGFISQVTHSLSLDRWEKSRYDYVTATHSLIQGNFLTEIKSTTKLALNRTGASGRVRMRGFLV